MSSTLPRNRLVIAGLGALNGVLYILAMYLLTYAVAEYHWRQYVRKATRLGEPIVQMVSGYNWSGITIVTTGLFALAAFLVHRVAATRLGPVLFWELVGIMAVLAWNVFDLSISWRGELSISTVSCAWVTSSGGWLYGPPSLTVVILLNFLYGILIKALVARGRI